MPSDEFYDKLNKAIGGSEPFTYSEKILGFPERIILPRGKPEGMRYKMFFFLSSMDESNMKSYEIPLYGKVTLDDKLFGFPLDRPMWAWNFTIPNMHFKDVFIYNRPNEKESMNYWTKTQFSFKTVHFSQTIALQYSARNFLNKGFWIKLNFFAYWLLIFFFII